MENKRLLDEKYWNAYNDEDTLKGLTTFGFKGNQPLRIKDFDPIQLDWAHDFALSCGAPIRSINRKHSSYSLKHLAEKRAKKLSQIDGENVDYITNGALILAMADAGFDFVHESDSPNVFFNVSERELKRLFQLYN